MKKFQQYYTHYVLYNIHFVSVKFNETPACLLFSLNPKQKIN